MSSCSQRTGILSLSLRGRSRFRPPTSAVLACARSTKRSCAPPRSGLSKFCQQRSNGVRPSLSRHSQTSRRLSQRVISSTSRGAPRRTYWRHSRGFLPLRTRTCCCARYLRAFSGASRKLSTAGRRWSRRCWAHRSARSRTRPFGCTCGCPRLSLAGVLLIENQTTFERAIRAPYWQLCGMALVYAAGFKGSASRLRQREGCSP